MFFRKSLVLYSWIVACTGSVFAQENYSTWPDSQRIYINTTSSGASVSNTVTNFPVLLRLNPSKFTRFSRTQPLGADIRFATSTGVHLNYQIERWKDGANDNDTAEIWVQIPSVIGNNNTQFIRMYYGKTGTFDSSRGGGVFDTTAGFQAVWHMKETTGDTIRDATINGFKGAPFDTLNAGLPSDVMGIIGNAKAFNTVRRDTGGGYYRILNSATGKLNFDTLSQYTISAWISCNEFVASRHFISKSIHGQYDLYGRPNGNISFSEIRGGTSDNRKFVQNSDSTVGGITQQWRNIVGVHTGGAASSMLLYVNGVLASNTLLTTNSGGGRNTTYDVCIGRSPSNAFERFGGKIDEAVISNVARSADWIKLSYETQKPTANSVIAQSTSLPTITTQPAGATVIVGASHNFLVTATVSYNIGTGSALRYAWYKNGAVVTGQTTSTLALTDIQLADSGTYYVVVSNEYGSVQSNNARLIVSGNSPTITTQPSDITVNQTEPAAFTVVASGVGTLSYQWYKVVGGQNQEVAGQTTQTLTIANAEFSDSGLYRCVVTNPYGSATSNTARLTVLNGAPVITVQPKDTVVLATRPASFTITATGVGTLRYAWYKGVVDASTRVATTRTLSFTSVVFSDSGSYICEIINDYGWVQSRAAKLTVNDGSPVITQHPRDTMVLENSAWNMSVTASGQPTLRYEWYQQGNSTKRGENRILTVSSAVLADAGSYYCVVSNGFGVDSSNPATLTVQPDLQVSNPIRLTGRLVDNTTVALTVRRFGQLPIQEQPLFPWYADTVMIWYRTGGFPTVPDPAAAQIKLSVPALQATGLDSFNLNVTVPQLPSCQDYFFKSSVLWKNTGSLPDSIPRFGLDADGARVFMCDTTPIANPLTMSFRYTVPNNFVVVTVTGLEDPTINWDLAQYLVLGYSIDSGASFIDSLTVPTTIPAGNTWDVTISNSRFAGSPASVEWRLYFKGIHGNKSDTTRASCQVGGDRPDNDLGLRAGEVTPTQVQLLWTNAGEPYDSFAVWYGTSPIPNDTPPSERVHTKEVVPGTDSSRYIRNLRSSTMYYFGIQGARLGIWSAIPIRATMSATTPRDSTVAIPNTVRLDSISFDSANPGILRIHYSVNQDPPGYQVQVGFSWLERSFDNPPQPAEFPEPSSAPKVGVIFPTDRYRTSLTQEITIADASPPLEYGKHYYFGIWLAKVNERKGMPTDSSMLPFMIPEPSVIPVRIFRNTDMITAFNTTVILVKIDDLDIAANLRKLVLPFDGSGLVQVSTTAFALETSTSTPIRLFIGLAYNPAMIPAPGTVSDIRMYRYDMDNAIWLLDNDTLLVDEGSSVIYIKKYLSDCRHPFALAVDIQPPVLSVTSDITSPVSPGNEIPMHLVVTENIANPPIVSLQAGKGDDIFILNDTLEEQVPVGESDWVIPETIVQGEAGVRACFFIYDGRFSVGLDVSRDILLTKSDETRPEQEQWTPLGATAVLDAPGVQQALDEYATPEGAWKYDIYSMRLFRFMQRNWLEYSDVSKDNFSFVPGRVIWIKTRKDTLIDLGSGRSISLKTPYAIVLPPKSWTDFCLPYRFDIRIGDIVSSADVAVQQVLQFYEWYKDETNNNRFVAGEFFLPLNQGMNDMTRRMLHVHGSNNKAAYTVWNDLNDSVLLRIPPVPTVLSSFSTPKTAAVPKGWSVAVRSSVPDGNLSPVFCAYVEGEKGGTLAYPLPPSWSKVQVGIFDKQRKGVYGNVIVRELVNGGYAYELVFENESPDRTRISYTVERLAAPRDIEIALIDPSDRTVAPGESQLTLDVAGYSREYRLLAIGTPQYIDGFGRAIRRGEFGITRISPNPFRATLRIQYVVPYGGLESIRCDIIDQLGRVVWSEKPGRAIHPGKNEILWTARDGKPLAAGAYFVRLVGFDGKGKKTAEKLARIMYLP